MKSDACEVQGESREPSWRGVTRLLAKRKRMTEGASFFFFSFSVCLCLCVCVFLFFCFCSVARFVSVVFCFFVWRAKMGHARGSIWGGDGVLRLTVVAWTSSGGRLGSFSEAVAVASETWFLTLRQQGRDRGRKTMGDRDKKKKKGWRRRWKK